MHFGWDKPREIYHKAHGLGTLHLSMAMYIYTLSYTSWSWSNDTIVNLDKCPGLQEITDAEIYNTYRSHNFLLYEDY